MSRRANDPSVWDFSRDFDPELVGQALKRLWSFDGDSLSPTIDASGEIPHCPLTLEPLEVPVFLADGCVYECTPILKWLRENDRSPSTNVHLSHKRAMKLKPWYTAIDKFLLGSSE